MSFDLTQRCLNNQLSGNCVSSAFTETAVAHTYEILLCKLLSCCSERVLHLCSGWMWAWYKTSSGDDNQPTTPKTFWWSPATQFPTPALNDWSRSKAFIGQDLFKTSGLKSSRSGIDNIGSKPSSEMGGSSAGEVQSRIRPSLRASMNAISTIVPDVVNMWRIN